MSYLRKVTHSSYLTKSDDLNNPNSPLVRMTEQADQVIGNLTEKRSGFLAKLFPDERNRAIIKGELALVKSEYEFRLKALEKLRETQLQSLTEACNQYLVREKAAIRANTAKFLLNKQQELQQEVNEIFEAFMSKLEEKLQELERISSPVIRKIREEKLEKEIRDFMQLQEKLLNQFQRIIDEGV